MRRLIYLGLLVAASLLTLDVKPASACFWGDDGYNASTYAPRAYGYGGYYGRGYYGRTYGYYGYGAGYYGYGARAVARGVVRRAAWRRWR